MRISNFGFALALTALVGPSLFAAGRPFGDRDAVDGKSYEGGGVPPDVEAADRLRARPGEEEAVVEAGIRALASRLR